MATTGANLITALAERLRDAGSTAHSRDLLRRILSHSQRAINIHSRIRSTSVNFTTSVGRTLYRNTEVASDVAVIDRIRALDRTLHETDHWHNLKHASRTWYRDVSDAPHTWAKVGGTLFALTPATWDPLTVQVVYVTTPADVVDGVTNVDISDEFLPMVLDLAEGIMLLKARLFPQMDDVLRRLADMIQRRPDAGLPRSAANV